jgi:agmatinase
MDRKTGRFQPMAHGVISMLGSPHLPTDQVAQSGAKVAFLGVPYDGANVCIGRPGSAMGPQGLRIASQEYFSWSFEWDIDLHEAYGLVDCGDARIAVGNAVRTHENVEEDVGRILNAGAFPVSIGGDHSLPIPCARALSKFLGPDKRMGYLAIDAHMDAGYSVDGEKETNCSGIARASELPNVRPENVAIVGVRGSLNPREWLQLIRERGINMYPMREVKERGIEPVLKDALDRVWDGTDGVYVTWDTDSVDASHAPGTTEPEPGGLTSHEILAAGRIIGERGFTALDNVELAPIYDISGITGKLVWCVLSEVLYANAKARA